MQTGHCRGFQYAGASNMWNKHYHKKHHHGTAFFFPFPSLPLLSSFLFPSFQSHVHQSTSGKSSSSCSLVLERTSCPQRKVYCGGDWVTLRTSLSKINFGIQGGGERSSAWGLIVPVYAQLRWLFYPVFPVCHPVLQKLLKSFLWSSSLGFVLTLLTLLQSLDLSLCTWSTVGTQAQQILNICQRASGSLLQPSILPLFLLIILFFWHPRTDLVCFLTDHKMKQTNKKPPKKAKQSKINTNLPFPAPCCW